MNSNSYTRARGPIAAAVALCLTFAAALALSGSAFAAVEEGADSASGPRIWTAKVDYVPSELVDLSGSGFQPGESVELFVDDDQTKTWTHRTTVTVDDMGLFYYEFRLPDWFVATYTVTATGETSGEVRTQFDDSIAQGSFGTNHNTGNSEITISAPAANVGDVLVAHLVATDSVSGKQFCPTGVNAAGWNTNTATSGTERLLFRDTQNKVMQQVLWRVATAANASALSYQFNFQNVGCSGGGVSLAASGGITVFTGVDATDAIDVAEGTGGSGSAVSGTAPSVTTTTANTHVLRFFGLFKNATVNPTTDRVYSITSSSGKERAAAAFGATQTGAGSSGTFTGNFTSSGEWVAQTVALKAVGCVATTVTSQPAGQSITYGGDAVFTAGGTGSPVPTVQWQVSTDGGSSWTNLPGQTSTTLTVAKPSVSQSGNRYRAVFTNTCNGTQTATSNAATLTVAPKGLTISGAVAANKAYDGTSSATVSFAAASLVGVVSGDTVTIDSSGYAAEFDTAAVGNDKPVTVTGVALGGADAGNYTVSQPSGLTANIAKAATSTTVTCTAGPFVFDGSAHEPCSASVTGPGGLNESLAVSYGSNVDAGTATASAAYAGSGNYLASGDSETFEIGRANAVIVVTGFTGTYDGQAHGATGTATGAAGGDLSDLLDLGESFTDVPGGTAEWSFAGDDNHNPASGSVAIEIGKAATTTTVTCPTTVVYNGAPRTPCSAVVTGPAELSESLAVSYGSNVDAGTATASAAYAGSDNYLASDDAKTFVILKAATTTTVSCTEGPFTFTGSAHEPCSASVTGPGGLNQSLTVSYEDNVDAGTATASASYAGSNNHQPSGDSKTFAIGKADATIVVTGFTGAYDGDPHGATGSATSADGVTDLSDLLDLGASFTDVPGGTADWTFAGDDNHNADSGTVAIVIDKAATTTTVSCTAGPFTFNGSAHEPCTASVSGPAGLDEELTVSYANNVDAGTATASAAYAGSGNYLASDDSATFAIGKANATIVVTGFTGTYDGQAHGATGSATGAAGGDLSGLLDLGASFTDVPGGTAEWTFAGNANHNEASGSVEIVINKADATIDVQGFSGVYDGTAKGATGTATGAGGGDLSSLLDLGAMYTNVPGGTASWTFAGDNNHNEDSGSVAIEIAKADADIDVQGFSGAFDGTAKGATGSATGADGSDLSGLLDLGATYTNVPGGTADWTFAGDDNHNADSGSVAIVIDKAATTTTVTCTAGPFTFDGSAHTPCSATVTGPDGLSQSPTVSYEGNVNAGTATASAAYAGSGNYQPSSDSETFEIGKAATATAVTCASGPFVYSGTSQTPCTAAVTGPAGLNESVAVSYQDNVNAGTATASAAYAGSGNYLASDDSATFEIGKAPSTTVVSCPASVTHTGEALEPCSAIATGAGGLNQGVAVTYTNNVNVGTATASASYAESQNHLASSDSKTFSIVAACRPTGTFLAPIKDGTRNVVKLGNVIPVKLRFADCNGIVVLGKTLSIRVVAGIVNGEDVQDGQEVLVTSVSSADTTGVMRFVDSQYMYNLSTKGLSTGLPYTIVIRDTTTLAWSSAPTVGTAVIEPRK